MRIRVKCQPTSVNRGIIKPTPYACRPWLTNNGIVRSCFGNLHPMSRTKTRLHFCSSGRSRVQNLSTAEVTTGAVFGKPAASSASASRRDCPARRKKRMDAGEPSGQSRSE